MFLNTEVVAQ